MAVVGIDVGIERSRINQKGYGATSAARISSMRSEMSSRPLRPAAAAPRCRWRPPRWLSIASRVSVDTVTPRLSASWRSLASSSSESLTVVRFMVCQHTTSCLALSVHVSRIWREFRSECRTWLALLAGKNRHRAPQTWSPTDPNVRSDQFAVQRLGESNVCGIVSRHVVS